MDAGGFDVRVVTRNKTANGVFNASVATVAVDYSSPTDLFDALKDCDVIVNALGDRVPFKEHVAVLDAAIAVGAKRYVPAQWGSTPRLEALLALPFIRCKLDIAEMVDKAAAERKLTFTSFAGGPWMEYVMEFNTMLSVPKRTFYIHEDPDFEFALTSRAMFGKALVAALQKPSATENKHLHVELVRISQKRALQLTKEALPMDEFETVPASFEERYQSGIKKLLDGVMDKFVFADVLSKLIFDPATNILPSHLDNDLLGVHQLTADELKDVLKETSKSTRY